MTRRMGDQRRPRWVNVLVIVLIVLAVGDRLALLAAEKGARHLFMSQVHNVKGADLQIDGFPFATQLLGRRLDHVTGSVESATIGHMDVSDVYFDLYGVRTVFPFTADHGVVRAGITLDTLDEALNDNDKFDFDLVAQRDMITVEVTVFGLVASVDTVPKVVGTHTVGVEIRAAHLGRRTVNVKDLPHGVGNILRNLKFPFLLPGKVSIDTVEVTEGGMQIQVSGKDVRAGELVGT